MISLLAVASPILIVRMIFSPSRENSFEKTLLPSYKTMAWALARPAEASRRPQTVKNRETERMTVKWGAAVAV